MHITVPSGATVITSDLSKYLTGPKSGIKAEVEEAAEEEKARDMSLHGCDAPRILAQGDAVVTCGPCAPLPSSWQNPGSVRNLKTGNTTV